MSRPDPKIAAMAKGLEEALAAYAHNAWAGWMKYLYEKSRRNEDGTVTIPADLVARWQRQIDTPYSQLPENEKESDRKEARAMAAIFVFTLAPEENT